MPDRPKSKKKRIEKSKNDGRGSKNSNKTGQKFTKVQRVEKSSQSPRYERSLSEITSSIQEIKLRSGQDSGFSETAVQSSELSSSDENDEKSEDGLLKSVQIEKMNEFVSNQNMLCTLCCGAPKNSCLVHGRISHQVCCYSCAKKLLRNHGVCPVCRRKIEKITKNIIA